MSHYTTLPVALVLWCMAPVALADDYADARVKLVAAYQAQDFPAMVAAAKEARRARPGYPGAEFNLALALALDGDPESALASLNALLRKRIDFGVADMDEFAMVRKLEGWADYERGLRQLHMPVGNARVAASLDDPEFIPEGIAIDAAGTVYLGSIRRGVVFANGEALSDRQGHWSVFGMRFHADGSLWFASAAVPQLENVGEDLGKTGLFRIDVQTGTITRAALLPQFAPEQVLGDLVIDGDIIYATDSLTGAVYRYDIKRDAYAELVGRGVFGSPQGLAFDESGDYLYVADYTAGLYRVRLADQALEKLRVADGISDHGIDGLYRFGDRLIAIQNGIRPHRVASFRLGDGGAAISDARILAANLDAFDEPTLGAVHDGAFYFVANSHWNRFDRENRLPEGLSRPIVLKIALDPQLNGVLQRHRD